MALSAFGNMAAAGISFILKPQGEIAGIAGWRLLFLVGVLPALLVVLVMRRIKEPEGWLKAKEALARNPDSREARKALGSFRELFGDARWRRHAIVGVILATAGVMGLWGVGFWSPELVRNHVLRGEAKEVQDWYASMAFLIQQAGAFFGIFAFSVLTSLVGRRPALAVSIVAGLVCVVGVFGFMTEPNQIWWMCPLLGFATLMIFGGYSIYFPELFPTRLRSTGVGLCYNAARYLTVALLFLSANVLSLFAAPAGSARAQEGLSGLTVLSSLGSAASHGSHKQTRRRDARSAASFHVALDPRQQAAKDSGCFILHGQQARRLGILEVTQPPGKVDQVTGLFQRCLGPIQE
jgi:MFS family permease